jgi:signal transduction histidine kinase
MSWAEKGALGGAFAFRLVTSRGPAILEDLGFTAAARKLVSNYAADSGLDVSVTIDNDRSLKGENGIVTYRILQEALENAQNHAEASHLSIYVRESERELSLVVEDDGKGFDSNREEARGLGLATMYERARMLNSSLEVCSVPGTGTRIALKIPR